jgi:soluble lytic murein transglycosylase-like protein
MCLLLVLGGRSAAQPDDGQEEAGQGALISADDPDPDAIRPLAFKPVAARPLTSADLPPASPLSGRALPLRMMSVAFGHDWRAARDDYRAIVERESLAQGLPPALVDAVMAVESRYDPAAVGLAGEVGLMQVMLPTARMLGFTGTPEQLAVPDTNIHYGTLYLAGAWRLAAGDLCTATMKYRAGHGETRFSNLSVDYCARVRDHLAANGVVVTGSVPQPSFGRPSPGNLSGGPLRGRQVSGSGRVDFVALNTRLRTLTERTPLRNSP